MLVDVYTYPKTPLHNEDAADYTDTSWVMCDGSTDKYGRLYDGKTGGELAAQLVLSAALETDLNGQALADHVTADLAGLYEDINPSALTDPQARFATTLLCARSAAGMITLTQVGDTGFRVNVGQPYFNNKIIDALTSEARAHYIRLTGDISGSRGFILPLLREQLTYSNNAQHPLGYGVIDGTPVPPAFVKTYTFPSADVQTLELFTDGYPALPATASIAAYEALYSQIQQEDPYRYQAYPATKTSDDRTVLIARAS